MRLAALLVLAMACMAGCEASTSSATPPKLQFQQTSAVQIEQGHRVADVLGCTGCHTADLTGEDWSHPEYGRLWTANLTRSAADHTDAELEAMIRDGRRPDRDLWGMPSHLFTTLSDDDMAAVIAFIRSKPLKGEQHPPPTFGERAVREIASGELMSAPAQIVKEGADWPMDVGPEHALGRYIVRATCAECHGTDLRGGPPMSSGGAPPDLRMLAAYEPEQFARLMKTGMPIGDRDLGLMAEVARGRYSRFTDAEISAVHAYLKRLAEVNP